MKSNLQVLCSFVVISYAAAAAIGKLPPSFTVCPQTRPDFDTCVARAIEGALKVLVKGYAPLGLYSVDPLRITTLNIDQGTGPVSINLKFKDLDILGMKNTKVNSIKFSPDKFKLEANVLIPRVTLKGKYAIDGKVLVLPIQGEGLANLELDDLRADALVTMKPLVKDGVTYAKVTKFDFKLVADKFRINLTNLFKGDKALGDNMNKFLNENSHDILAELNPAIQDAFGAAFGEITDRIFTKVPINDIYPLA